MTTQEQIALDKYNKGEKFGVSTFIDEDTIILGYGGLDTIDFKFPLPAWVTVKEFGTQSWEQYYRNKGLFTWQVIDKENKVSSLLGFRQTEEDINELKLLEGNENFEFIKL